MEKEIKCNCCGWDDGGYMHEPNCNLYKPNKPMENEIIKEFDKKFGQQIIIETGLPIFLPDLICYEDIKQFILTKLKERDDEIKRLTLMFQTTTFDLSSAENKLKEEYQKGYNKGVFDHSARLEDVINEASEKARQEGYEVGFAQAESGLPNPMIEFIRKDERIKTLEEVKEAIHSKYHKGISEKELLDLIN